MQFAGATAGYFNIYMRHSVNGIVNQKTGFFNSIAQNWYAASSGATLHLNAGDAIWMEVNNGQGGMTFYNGESSFSGHLVYAD